MKSVADDLGANSPKILFCNHICSVDKMFKGPHASIQCLCTLRLIYATMVILKGGCGKVNM